MAQKKKVRFIRKGGRIIPIRIKNEIDVAKQIARKGRGELAKVAGISAASLGGAYGAGKLASYASKIKSRKFNFAAKILKFSVSVAPAIAVGSAIVSLDRKVNDEKAQVLRLGNQSKNILGTVAHLGLAYGAYRFGKRFEVAGRKGINLFKKSGISKFRKLKMREI